VIARGGARGQDGTVADADKRIVHVELHRRHQSLEDLAVDVAEAQIRLFRRERRLVLSQVWDLYGNADAPVLDKRTLAFGEGGSQCVYQRVNLRGLGADELLSRAPPTLWPLVPLTRDGANEAVIEKARDMIEARTAWSSTERADHLAVLWFVAEAEGVAAEVMQEYLAEERLMESELYKRIFEKGEARGEARGKAQAYAEMLIRLLIHRMGSVAPAIRERIRGVSDLDLLNAWYEEALLASDADATRRLADKIQHAALT